MAGHSLAIVIPAFNEERAIGAVVEKIRAHGQVIVVSDCSQDRTADVARAVGATVVELQKNVGYDGALNAGFKAAAQAGADYILTMDADGQHPAELILVFLEKLKTTADVVAGVRDRRQRVSEMVFSWVGAALFRLDDPVCGMKGYRRAVYDALGHFDLRKSIGTELVIFAVQNGFKVEAQITVPTKPRLDAPRFGRALKGNWRIFKAICGAFADIVRHKFRNIHIFPL